MLNFNIEIGLPSSSFQISFYVYRSIFSVPDSNKLTHTQISTSGNGVDCDQDSLFWAISLTWNTQLLWLSWLFCNQYVDLCKHCMLVWLQLCLLPVMIWSWIKKFWLIILHFALSMACGILYKKTWIHYKACPFAHLVQYNAVHQCSLSLI